MRPLIALGLLSSLLACTPPNSPPTEQKWEIKASGSGPAVTEVEPEPAEDLRITAFARIAEDVIEYLATQPSTGWYVSSMGKNLNRTFDKTYGHIYDVEATSSPINPLTGYLQFSADCAMTDRSGKSWSQSRNFDIKFIYRGGRWTFNRLLVMSTDDWYDATISPAYQLIVDAAKSACDRVGTLPPPPTAPASS